MRDRNGVPQILRDWFDRRNGGESLDAENYLREHAGRADDLPQRLDALQALECALTESFGLPEGPPEAIGEYRIIRELGRGGMGVVYEAEQVSMQRRVALKLLTPVFTGSRTAVQRFHREARAAGRLHHTNIVPVYGLGTHGEYLYYTMELVEGQSLGDFIKDLRGAGIEGDTAHFHRVAEMFAGVAEALDVVHQEGVIHRDVKPANLLLDGDGTLKIVDFGMARLDQAPSMTLPGEFLGTPTYMSPEQAKARQSQIDHRTDIYSLGATLYEALILRPPFEGESILEIRAQIIAEDPTPPIQRNRHVPRDLSTVVLKAMEKEPGDRYPTAGAMARDLRRFVDGVPIQARPLGFAERAWRKMKRHKVRSSLAAVIALLVVTGFVFAIQSSRNAAARRDLEYHQLLVRGEEAGAASMSNVVNSEWKSDMSAGDTARDHFTRAIELIPARPYAYWLRSLAPGRTLEERLADLVAARERGLSARTERLLRAYLISVRKPSKSIAAREEVKRLEPQTPAECYAKARVLETEGRRHESIELLDRAVRSAGRGTLIHYMALRRRASIHRRRGDVETALQDLLEVQALGDDRVSIRIGIASLWKKLGSKKRGESEFENALRQTQIAGTVAVWNDLCGSCSLNRETAWLDRASALALDAHPKAPGVLFYRALACDAAGRAEAAMELCGRALAAHPENHRAHRLRADLLEKRGDYAEALREFGLALDRAPNCGNCLIGRGILLSDKLDKHEVALADFDRAIERSPHKTSYVRHRAIALLRLGRLKEALSASQRSIELDPENVAARMNLGILLNNRLKLPAAALEQFDAVIDLQKDHALAWANRGVVLAALAKFDDAFQSFERALQLGGDPAWTHHRIGVALGKADRHDEQLQAYAKVLELDPAHCDALNNKAACLTNLGRNKAALEAWNEGLRHYPDHFLMNLNRANVLTRLQRFNDALDAYERAIALDSTDINARCGKAEVLAKLERHAEARDAWEEAIENDPDGIVARMGLGRFLHHNLEKPAEALKHFNAVIKRQQDHVEAWEARGVAQRALGKHGDAIRSLKRALELDGTASRYLLYGNVLADSGRFEEARDACRKAISVDPKSAKAYYNMGVYLGRLRRPEEALRAYNTALELDPNHGRARYNQANAWNNWAGLLVKQGRLEEALGELNKALLKHRHRIYLYLHKADVLGKLKRFDDALATCEKAVRRSKRKDAKARYSRGFFHLQLGHYDEALQDFNKVIVWKPGFGSAYFYRGVVWLELERLEKALADFEQALKIDSASSPARQNVVVMLNRLRRHPEAAQVLERGLRSYPKDAGLLWRLVTVRSSLQDHEGALDAANRALALEGSSDSNLARRALILVDLGRLAAARADLEKAEEANPKSTYVAWCRQEILLRTGDYRGALAAAGAARKSITALKYALVRVTCFRGLGRDDDASKIAARAIAGDDPPRDKRLEFAYLCAAAGDRKRAESFLEAWDLPWQPDDLYERARIHAVLGDKKAALEWLERAADKGLKRSAKLPPDPDFKALEDAPQYQGLLKKIRF